MEKASMMESGKDEVLEEVRSMSFFRRISAIFHGVLDIYTWFTTHTHTNTQGHTHLNACRPMSMHAHTLRIILIR